ncbi:MAG: tRNA 2-thiouridine(34) synthase MnmA, partial [Nanoarchaeota archaeon]|nr:tRNA 2-thiouridine(34) synthase MnmA [Nanoarchaeota archaeon]
MKIDETTDKKVVVGMSGGVDSSITMLLLKRQGWQPIGVSLKLETWKGDKCKNENACCTEESLKIAKEICQKLGVKHYIYDVRK